MPAAFNINISADSLYFPDAHSLQTSRQGCLRLAYTDSDNDGAFPRPCQREFFIQPFSHAENEHTLTLNNQ
jgi:hypothetical protein